MSSLAVYQTFCHRLSVVVRKCEFFAVCMLMLIGSLQDFCIILVVSYCCASAKLYMFMLLGLCSLQIYKYAGGK